MRNGLLVFCCLLLIILLAACTYPQEQIELPTEEAAEEEVKEAAIDYCDLPGETRVTWFDLSTFIFIPQNSYQMGFDIPDAEFDFEPAHPVSLGAFWMHETEVTNRQYANCVTAEQCAPPEQYPDVPYWFDETDQLDDPVVGVTWEQADAYCQWIGTRLPTETEWELAARGVKSEPYPWGTDAPDCEHANYKGCLDPEDPQPDFAGLLPKGISPFEMLDMAGNVNEWVHDWYGEDYYQNSPSSHPSGPDIGELRVWRGGGYQSPAGELFSYLRNAFKPDEAQPDLGFRCAWSCGKDVPPALCQLPPLVGSSGLPIGEPPPAKKPEVSAEGYCEWREGTQYPGVVLAAAEGTHISQFKIESVQPWIICMPAGAGKMSCFGTAITPDNTVEIIGCPECQEGTYFDIDTGFCKPIIHQLDPQIEELTLPEEEEDDPCTWEEYLNGECIPSWMKPDELECLPGMKHTEECGCIFEWMECGDSFFPEPEEEEIECPPGFQPAGDLCIPMGPIDPMGECDPGHHEVEPCGCIPWGWICVQPHEDGWEPLIFPSDQVMPDAPAKPGAFEKLPGVFPLPKDCNETILMRCPPGMISIKDEDDCQTCSPIPALTDCPEGYTFDSEVGCCIPDIPVSVCPSWTHYDPVSNTCIPIVFHGQSCFELEVYVPGCGPRPKVEPSCVKPEQYTNQTDCEAATCKWDGLHPLRGNCVMP